MSEIVEFTPQKLTLPEHFAKLPTDFWEVDRFIELAAGEAFNLDEFSDEGYLVLKRMLFRVIVPKSEWKSADLNRFKVLLSEKYKSILNEPLDGK